MSESVDLAGVIATIRHGRGERAVVEQQLLDALAIAVPAGLAQVTEHRSWRQRRRGEPGRVTEVAVGFEQFRYRLAAGDQGLAATIEHHSGGITIATQKVRLDRWLSGFEHELAQAAAEDAAVQQALLALRGTLVATRPGDGTLDDSERAAFLVRARGNIFTLAGPPDLTDDPVTLSLVPEVVHLDRPIDVSFAHDRLWRAGTQLDIRLGASFPAAEVNGDGRITSYGETAVLHGADFPGLPVWVDSADAAERDRREWEFPSPAVG